MNKLLSYLNKLDWLLSFGTLGAAYYFDQPLLYAAAAAGFLMAWYKPANRIKARIDAKLVRKAQAPSDAAKMAADEAFYEEFGAHDDTKETAFRKDQRFDRNPAPAKISFVFSTNKHNQVHWEHLDLTTASGKTLV